MTERKVSLEELLASCPELRERLESLVDIIRDPRGELDLADDAEEQVIGELRQLGREVMESWARHKEAEKVARLQAEGEKVKKHGKKKSAGTRPLVK